MKTERINQLLAEPREQQWLEFKDSYYEPHVLGEYLSALANSACLAGRDQGYLMFGVEDATHQIVGTTFRPGMKKVKQQPLEFWLNQLLQPKVGLDIEAGEIDGKTVVLFAVGAAKGQPVRFNGVAYVRIDSCKTQLRNHPELERRIWTRGAPDWSAQTPAGATLEHLDPIALTKARDEYKQKNRHAAFQGEIDSWDELTFLSKARLAIEGRLTNAAVLLLGKPESLHLIQPAVARMTWVLRGADGLEVDYAHFDPPFLLNVDRLFAKVRNLTIREMPDGTLFPVEISQYDPWVMREALHNCIAHQDYRLCSRITVVETPDSLLFVNAGTFLPGSVEAVLRQDAPQRYYPNRLLTEAMVNLNMIDTIGSGIRRMFVTQKRRFLPMPDYDLSQPEEVRMRLAGRVLDENYTKLLVRQTDLTLDEAILLDKVQKGVCIGKDEHASLKRAGLVEGRYPNLLVSAQVAAATGKKADYIRRRGQDDAHYERLVLDFLKEFGSGTREELDDLLMDKLPDVLSEDQKRRRIGNLLSVRMRRRGGLVENQGSRSQPRWVLTAKGRKNT
jgi:ATP-dependent DNA helicase RecG